MNTSRRPGFALIELLVFLFEEDPASEKYKNAATKVNAVPEKYWGPNTILEADVTKAGQN